jgi:hypothetical protein
MYTTSPGFTSRFAPVKDKAQRKVSSLAKRTNSQARARRAPGPVVVVYSKAA